MRQLTLVALYGKKPAALARLVQECQGLGRRLLGDAFVPYAIEQVHATVVGLARSDGLRNCCSLGLRETGRELDLAAVQHWLHDSATLPIHLRFGGFGEYERPFTSRGASPYERSFSLQDGKLVLIGWPTGPERGSWPDPLDLLRRELQRFGILHRYHVEPGAVDNDAYLRLGLLRGAVDDERCADLEELGRLLLSDTPPVEVELGIEQLAFVTYDEDSLPTSSSVRYPLHDPEAWRRALAELGWNG